MRIHAHVYVYLCAYILSFYYLSLGNALITSGTATVKVSGLECGVTYTIVAGGILNSVLIGPRSSHENITTSMCVSTTGSRKGGTNLFRFI